MSKDKTKPTSQKHFEKAAEIAVKLGNSKGSDDWPITTSRFIAYFDIMGFKDRIYRSSHKEIEGIMNEVSKVVQILNSVGHKAAKEKRSGTQTNDSGSPFQSTIFSDSILLVSESNTEKDLKTIVFAASIFLYEMMSKSIPVKGALAFGQFTADFELSKFFGIPLVDAYLLAEETKFYGAAIHQTIDKYIYDSDQIDNDYTFDNALSKYMKVPMKQGKINHRILKWEEYIGIGSYDDSGKSAADILEIFYHTASGNVRSYVDNSIEVYKS